MASSSTSALGLKPVPRATFLATVCASAPDFWTLTKPEVNFLIVIATFAGFYLGYPTNLDSFPFARLFHTLCGTLLVASGTGTLNQYLEYHFDAQMRRTRKRPIAAGRLQPATALWSRSSWARSIGSEAGAAGGLSAGIACHPCAADASAPA